VTKTVPYLEDEAIERDAALLLAEFAQARGVKVVAPIPIEDIIEKHLKLRIEFDDTHKLFGVPRSGLAADILGAMFFDDARIVIDESLDPEDRPQMERRYRFTLAHEGGGHWRLHRALFLKDRSQTGLFDVEASPSVICRSSQAKARVEWQADSYASCLLMPRKLVLGAWDELFPDRKQRVLSPRTQTAHPFVEIPRMGRWGGYDGYEDIDAELDRFARPLADRFLVSPTAMRIRLEKLGLLYRELPHQRLLIDRA
jgi:Zn-dependent peptidase ImmA (M78 family)